MQKKLIALAVAGMASSAAFAQSSTNVTLYGIVDMAYLASTSSGTGSKTSGIDAGGWSSSRIGFRGTEDLGGGLKAIFTLEYGLTPDVNSGIGNTGGTNARQTFVGLTSSSWGTVRLGRFNSLGKDGSDNYDAMGSTTFSPLYSMVRGNAVTTGSAAGTNGFVPGATSTYSLSTQNSGRLSNAVDFKSTSMAGFVVAVQYSFAPNFGDNIAYNTAANPNQESIMTAGIEYKDGPFGINGVYQRARAISDTNNSYKADEYFLGASYDFGMAKLMGTYQTIKRNENRNYPAVVNPPMNKTDDIWSAGVQIPVTPADKVYVGYAAANDGSALNNNSDSWGIQYAHDLSKRTMLYAGYQTVNNDNGADRKSVV